MLLTRSSERNNVELARTSSKGTGFIEAAGVAEACGRKLISSRKAGDLLESGKWIDFESAFPLWTGTLVAYPECNKAFGVIIDLIDGGFRYWMDTDFVAGRSGIALVLESGTYDIHDETRIKVIVPHIPPAQVDFPQGNGQVSCGLLEGHVIRSSEGGIFAAVRGHDINEHAKRKQSIRLNEPFSRTFGVLHEGAYGSIPPKPVEESYLHSSGGD
jgi:hypothetical protein